MEKKIKEVLKKKFESWEELEKAIEKISDTTEKGDAFEQVCYFYLMYHKNLYQIKDLYTSKIEGSEIPRHIENLLKLSHKDDGVDGVYVTKDGKYTAYQCKFRSGRRSPSSNELNDFWSEAEYADNRLVMANCVSLPKDTIKRKKGSSILVDKFDDLDGSFFRYLYESANGLSSSIVVEKLVPKEFQEEIINSTVNGFENVERGKIIAACATGKTLISLWISERMNSNTVLFFAPNLSLVRQSIERWTLNAEVSFAYLAVCSDESVSDDIGDDFKTQAIDLDVPVTTDPNVIIQFLKASEDKRVIFSTYQSAECIVQALKAIPDFSFDLGVYDEAHRTAGKSDSGLFSMSLKDESIAIKKRLFMTATERLVKPWIRDKFEQEDVTIFSMDDESIYGPVFYKFTFGEAIKQKIISDYRIVVAAITSDELKTILDKNRYLRLKMPSGEGIDNVTAELVFKSMLLGKSVKETNIKKIVSFHSSINNSKDFIAILSEFDDELLKTQFNINKETASFLHINGSQTASARSDAFKEFEKAEFGLLSNVRCLTEGVDMPFIDGILFADPKGSMIDIVQAVGRALRKPMDVHNKVSYIIIPIIVNMDGTYDEDDFSPLHSVIQALRDQDDTLAEWIDSVNLGLVKGKRGYSSGHRESKIKLLLSESIDAQKFVKDLSIRIATVNAKPAGVAGLGATLGKKQRGSEYKRIFKCIGDYNYLKYKESLVDPTIEIYTTGEERLSRKSIVINNNNVSHCVRLGVIKKVGANEFVLTALGKLYKLNKISFEDLFINEMLIYTLDEGEEVLYPYRATLEILLSCNSLNYIEFLYSVYSLRANKDERQEVDRAVEMIRYIRQEYPNVIMTSVGNQEKVRSDLNDKHQVGFSERDVWTDRTTTGNQYRFLLNHLLLFNKYFNIDLKKKTIEVNGSMLSSIKKVLAKSKEVILSSDYEYGEKIWYKKDEDKE